MDSIIDRIEIVPHRFGDLLDRFVFVGGATTSLFVTDSAVTDIRPTKDIMSVIDGRPEPVNDVGSANSEIQEFIQTQLKNYMAGRVESPLL